MASALSKILNEYVEFETAVGRRMAETCAPHCSVCRKVCCRPEFCRESIDSPFLNLIRAGGLPHSAYRTARGWLTTTGCALAAGRPPVCYQFNCNQITGTLTDDRQRYLFEVLANLVPYIGRRSLGGRHLVEIMDPADLERIRYERFARRLKEAREALRVIASNGGCDGLTAECLAKLSKIVPLPRSFAG